MCLRVVGGTCGGMGRGRHGRGGCNNSCCNRCNDSNGRRRRRLALGMMCRCGGRKLHVTVGCGSLLSLGEGRGSGFFEFGGRHAPLSRLFFLTRPFPVAPPPLSRMHARNLMLSRHQRKMRLCRSCSPTSGVGEEVGCWGPSRGRRAALANQGTRAGARAGETEGAGGAGSFQGARAGGWRGAGGGGASWRRERARYGCRFALEGEVI